LNSGNAKNDDKIVTPVWNKGSAIYLKPASPDGVLNTYTFIL